MTLLGPLPTVLLLLPPLVLSKLQRLVASVIIAIFATLLGPVSDGEHTPYLRMYAAPHCTGADGILLFRERLRRMSRDQIVKGYRAWIPISRK
ncbi:hypothetical protein F4810DRAFT_608745 [Camillea tinctor]|nr:hypothetical protein F4810DRAFT_608745 [Camillea tinctor]